MLGNIGSNVEGLINSFMNPIGLRLSTGSEIKIKVAKIATVALFVIGNGFFNPSSVSAAPLSTDVSSTRLEDCMNSNCTQTDHVKYGDCFRDCIANILGNNT